MMNLIPKIATIALALSAAAHAAEPPAAPAPQVAPANPSATDQPAPQVAATPATVNRTAHATTPTARGTADRLDLDTTVVTGNRELPKVLYIVPWKKANIGDLPAQPFNTLLDEVLTPVDRDVFRREVTYYGAVSSSGQTPPAAAASGGSGTEK